jgi:hypothetical protein
MDKVKDLEFGKEVKQISFQSLEQLCSESSLTIKMEVSNETSQILEENAAENRIKSSDTTNKVTDLGFEKEITQSLFQDPEQLCGKKKICTNQIS